MAYNYTTQTDGVGVPFNYTRGNPIPLDSWSLFMSKSDAETYANWYGAVYVSEAAAAQNEEPEG